MTWTDTHCHIHDPEFFPEGGQEAYERAIKTGVKRLICVGTDVASSQAAMTFSEGLDGCFASVGIHPHDTERELERFGEFAAWCMSAKNNTPVAVGEIGLDYYYENSPRTVQIELLNRQIELAQRLQVPIIFHVREAFEDFWPIFDSFSGIEGVLHSYTDDISNLEKGLARGLFIGINGIATFARDRDKITRAVPLDRMLLETDAPFLTPTPHRGKINEPAFVVHTARFVADLRSISLEELSHNTENNATKLFF